MTPRRLYLLLLSLLGVLLIGLLVGTYGAEQLLTGQAGKLTGLKAKSQALSQEQATLTKAKQDIQKYASLEQIATAIVPQDKNQAEAVREIVNLAAADNIQLSSITFPASTLGGSGTSTSNSGAASSLNAPSTRLSQLQAVKNIPGVYALQISVQSDPEQPTPYSSFINFLGALEHNRRTAQISTIAITPSTSDPSKLTFSLTLNEYIKP